ncbi:glycosyltransferase family 2 protein [Baudoinia panamericana UAMH 10762]|uniref:Glycosyltransferase family 2 protein n=1 Tax=Baudoinia panamericana (strain UAMH 10762) TaxID=717646 RepID=M2N1S5_BAUPA|nr:glycosyltransferase family 2 protein [Baudoinia panamericana UAMH 10762]EMC92914.1 glycosyltransferase family 2 protein [Baudoinia panamericana UAMH 10762]
MMSQQVKEAIHSAWRAVGILETVRSLKHPVTARTKTQLDRQPTHSHPSSSCHAARRASAAYNLFCALPLSLSEDVTVIVPTTFKSETELTKCLQSVTACSPAAVLVVTAKANVSLIEHICSLKSFKRVRVLDVDKLNKRRQMIRALKEVETDIIVFADDDVLWPEQYLDYLLAIFEDPKTGAGGTRQRVSRNHSFLTSIWNFLGIAYLERRVWNNIATNAIDGSLSTLSGRTAAYKTEILKSEEFFHYFLNDHWRGRPLNTDDDKCLTRYVYSHGWSIAIQCDSRSVIETNMEDSPKYIAQCLRWARAHWRGNLTVMENERYWFTSMYWGLYVIYIGQFQTPAALVDGSIFALLYTSLSAYEESRIAACECLALWVFLVKVLKLLPHFFQHPQDMIYIPASIVFSYLHGIINIYALLTLTKTHWGSQDLDQLQHARATRTEVVPLLRRAMQETEAYHEPTFSKLRHSWFVSEPC